MTVSSRPVFVLVPGASQSPAAYGYLLHLLQLKGYGAYTALIPSVGASEPITATDDAEYVRSRMLLPVLDIEQHNVIVISHSYSGIPASAAASGLGKADRAAQGKTTSVLGQIFIAAVIAKGGNGLDLVANFGGQLPPHIRVDPGKNIITSPCPAASWDSEAFEGRVAYVRTVNDQAIPYRAQQMMLQATGVDWITRDIETSHSPQLAAPEKLADILVELASLFEELN